MRKHTISLCEQRIHRSACTYTHLFIEFNYYDTYYKASSTQHGLQAGLILYLVGNSGTKSMILSKQFVLGFLTRKDTHRYSQLQKLAMVFKFRSK